MRPDFAEVAFKELVLDFVRVYCQQRIGAFTQSRMTPEVFHDRVVDQMVYRLSTDVLSHRVGTDDVVVPFEREQGVPFYWTVYVFLSLQFIASIALVGPVSNWFLVPALTSIGALVAWLLGDPKVRVRGEVVVPVTLYNTFPEADVVYPDNLGCAVRVVTQGEPSLRWDR